ncbi:MAG: protein kinase, partial [Phenylobacterium sp.]|nr:protein kinase [Phenylobacterium sp.]
VNVLGVVQRELTLGPAAEIDAVERMSGLLGHGGSFEDLTAELCAKLRAGEMDASTPGLLAALRANAQDQVAIDQPNYASAR